MDIISPLDLSPARERRGSRARRRLSARALAGNASGEEDEDFPVIDTTSAEVERTADGSVAKVNEYVVVRDLGRGSSAEVKLCRLVLSVCDGASSRGEGGEGLLAARETRGNSQEALERKVSEGELGVDEDDGDLYAVKIFDRAEMMRRGGHFARRRARGPDGGLLTERVLPEAFVKVQREIAIMKELVHPNVVQLVEVIDAPLDSSLYMIMEHVERGAVMYCVQPERGRYASPLTGDCLDAITAARYFADILSGLEYLHLNLIAHRDLKPENVLIGDDNRAKIADFGVSKYFTDDEIRTPKTARSLARSTSCAQTSNAEGTWSFWAPEMCGAAGEGAVFNAYAADAWAAGVTLWCMLYGTVPFFRASPMDLFDAIVRDAAPVPDGADDELKDLLVNILAKDPCSRLAVSEARAHEWVAHTDRRFSVSDTVKAAPASAAVASGAAAAAAAPVLVTATSTAVTAGAAVRESLSNEGLTSGAFAGAAATAAAAVANNLASLSGRRFRRVVHLGGETVSISEEDVRAAVAEAPSFVLVAKIKDRIKGQGQARRRSNKSQNVAAAVREQEGGGLFTANNRSSSIDDEGYEEDSLEETVSQHHHPRVSSVVCVVS